MSARKGVLISILLDKLFFVCLSIVLSGCIQSIAPPSFTSEPTITFNPNPQAPLGAIVKFSTNKPVTTAIRIKDGEWERELIYDKSYNPEEGLPVIGLVPDKTHELRVFIHDDFGRLAEAAEKLEFHSLGLPEDRELFPPIDWTVHKADEMEPGILLLNPRRRRANDPAFGQGFGLLIALNGKGKVVWFYRTDSRISDFQRLRNGNIVYITQDFRVVEIDWLGNVQAEWYATGRPDGATSDILIETMAIHHIDWLPEKGNVLFTIDTLTPGEGETVSGARVREYSHLQPDEVIAELVLKDTSATNPVGWTIIGVEHLPYIIPCNYCYSYPGPPRPRKRPF